MARDPLPVKPSSVQISPTLAHRSPGELSSSFPSHEIVVWMTRHRFGSRREMEESGRIFRARSFNMEWFLWNYSSWNDRLIYTNVDQLE